MQVLLGGLGRIFDLVPIRLALGSSLFPDHLSSTFHINSILISPRISHLAPQLLPINPLQIPLLLANSPPYLISSELPSHNISKLTSAFPRDLHLWDRHAQYRVSRARGWQVYCQEGSEGACQRERRGETSKAGISA